MLSITTVSFIFITWRRLEKHTNRIVEKFENSHLRLFFWSKVTYSVNYSRQQVQSAYLLIFVNTFYLQKHLWAIALCIMMHFCSTTSENEVERAETAKLHICFAT